jgi:hypothetical protein
MPYGSSRVTARQGVPDLAYQETEAFEDYQETDAYEDQQRNT